MLLAVRLTWRHSETYATRFFLPFSNETKALDKLCKAGFYCNANRQFPSSKTFTFETIPSAEPLL